MCLCVSAECVCVCVPACTGWGLTEASCAAVGAFLQRDRRIKVMTLSGNSITDDGECTCTADAHQPGRLLVAAAAAAFLSMVCSALHHTARNCVQYTCASARLPQAMSQ